MNEPKRALLLWVLLLWPGLAHATEQASPPDACPFERTQSFAAIRNEAVWIAQGRVQSVRRAPLRQRNLLGNGQFHGSAKVAVERVLKGTPPGRRLTIKYRVLWEDLTVFGHEPEKGQSHVVWKRSGGQLEDIPAACVPDLPGA